MQKQSGLHYSWVILICVCLIYGAGVGMIGNTAGLYLQPVAKEMGWASTKLNFYLTIVQIVMTICLPIFGRIYAKVNIRILVPLGLTIMSAAYILSAFATHIWHWYIIGAFLGIAYALVLYLPGPLLVNNWFNKKVGLALGIGVAFASLTAIVANPVCGWIIKNYDWRTARIIAGSCAWLISVPFCVIFIRYKPEDKGLKPYGYEEKTADNVTKNVEKTGVYYKDALKNPSFYLLFLLAGLIVFCANMHMMTPSYADSIGLSPTVGATAVSVIMAGGVCGKFLLGVLVDKIGSRNTTLLAMLLGMLGAAVITLAKTNVPVFYTGAFLFGFSYAALTIVPPLVTRSVFGQLQYEKVYSSVTIAFGAFGAVAPIVYGRIKDVFGTYEKAWIFVFFLYLVAFIAGYLIYKFGSSLKWHSESEIEKK